MKRALLAWCCVAILLPALTTSAGAKSKHRPCPRGQVRIRQGCKTPLGKNLVTYRSADRRVGARLAPNAYRDSAIVWQAAVVYPYQRPCGGPALTGVLAVPIKALNAPFTTKTPYVGTTFSGKTNQGGGVQEESGGWRSVLVTVSTSGRVLSTKTLTGTVTVTETRGFGPTPSNQTTYTTCGSTFSFSVHSYRGAFPPR